MNIYLGQKKFVGKYLLLKSKYTLNPMPDIWDKVSSSQILSHLSYIVSGTLTAGKECS